MTGGLLGQLGGAAPEIPWGALSPELILFATAILVLLLETAGRTRVQVSGLVLAVLAASGAAGYVLTGAVVWPALLVFAGAAQLGLAVTWRDRPRVLSALLTAVGFVATLAAVGWQWFELSAMDGAAPGLLGTDSVLGGMVAVDGVALFTRATVCLAGLATIPLGWSYVEQRRIHRAEYYPLLALAAVGMNLLASSQNLIMVFISIEVLSLALYILTGFAKRDPGSQEGAFKYFLLGAFSSAILLYGVALAYGVAGTTDITQVGAALSALDAPAGLSLAAMALLIVGLAFKTALVPFHMWTPDAYQAAPTPVTGFMAAATKAAAFAAFLRIFAGALGGLGWSWVPALWTLAAITMLAGAVLAVVQDDLKRMLGYSAIAHAGYALVGLVAVSRDGVSGTLFYLLVYAVMSVGSFGVLTLLERRQSRAVRIADVRGLGRRHPLPAGLLALFLLSLAGIPGTAGFMAKLAVFRAGVQAGQSVLVVLAVVSSMIAAFFYIRVIRALYMEEEPAELSGVPLAQTPGAVAGLVLSAAVIVVLGLVPTAVVDLARQAAAFAG